MADIIASAEVTILDVMDGIADNLYLAYADNSDGSVGFSFTPKPTSKYIGTYKSKETTQSTDRTRYTWLRHSGDTGPKGEKGDNGADGVAGKDGKGITRTVVTYGISASETTQPSTWTTTVPTLVKGQYLWTKTVWTYSDSTNETGYTKTYIAKDGNNGTNGIAGKDGVGIRTTTITYASSPSGTTAPTSGWSTSVPTVSPGMFLWTKTIWTYTDNTTETGYSVAKMGDTGPKGEKGDRGTDGIAGKDGKGITRTVITYGLSTSETIQPSTWTSTVPNLVKGQYLWTKTVWTYSDNTTETGYVKTYIAKDGNDGTDGIAGKDGVGIKSTSITYVSSPSGTSTPTSGWSTSVPTVSPGLFLWTRTIWTYTDNTTETGYSVARMGASSYTHIAYANMTQLATEHSSFTLSARSTVRYGKDANWFYKTFDVGTYTATNATFGGDPYPKAGKVVELVADFSVEQSASKTHVGIYADHNEYDSTNPASYRWTKWKGAIDTEQLEEINNDIASKADSQLTQEQLNALNEQNNRIQVNMEALAAAKVLTDLEEAYNEYVRANDAAKKVSEGELATLKERTAKHVTKLAEFAEDWEFMTTKLRIAEEGIYFGKLDGSSEIKITDDRISFWSSKKEVMWITAGTLNIDNGIFTVSVQIGRFREEQYTTNPDINVIRYVG